MLNASNLSSFTESIILQFLPRTFRDAIDITRRMGFHYLWIDSLCILQSGNGSHEDWLDHALQMRSVYLYCILNIAAHSAKNPHDGIYSSRDTKFAEPVRVQWHNFTDETTTFKLFFDIRCGYEYLETSRLSSRAWVVQERYLSRRVLHMASDQILWQCNEVNLACECFPKGIDQYITNYLGQQVFDLYTMFAPPSQPKREDSLNKNIINGNDPRVHWRKIITEYSSCDLSKPDEDKFFALSGVTRIVSEILKESYVAGYLRSTILFDLVWKVEESNVQSGRCCRPQGAYRAPSWSWASFDGPVKFGRSDCERELTAEVHNIDLHLVDPQNPWGALRSTVLVVRAALLRLKPFLVKGISLNYLRGKISFDGEAGKSREFGTVTIYADLPWPELMELEKTHKIFAIPLVKIKYSPRRSYADGLVLKMRHDRSGYERVGHFCAFDDDKLGLGLPAWKLRSIEGCYQLVHIY
jgi:Heterokaryon incompatibility protein (HET)